MRLFPGALLFVPERLAVPVLSAEARPTGFGFEGLPVEGYGGGVEERAEELFVAVVVLLFAQLLEIEDVGSEDEIMRDLLDPDLAPRGDIGECHLSVGLAVPLDVAVDACLLCRVPLLPVLRAHAASGILRPGGGDVSLGRRSVRCKEQGGDQ